MTFCKSFLLALGLILCSAFAVAAKPYIEHDSFTLDNGLRVIVHEDRKAPVVAVNVWYHVGSKDEPAGKTGFAHLFEHIMFKGSENFSGDFHETLKNAGATSVNGTTNFDRTLYFETVPTEALELVLWIESDRMGYLLGAVTQETLDAERGIVQNEKRQREGVAFGRAYKQQIAALYPEGHRYHHPTIGSMADLAAASLEDVHGWFKDYYGASNALLVLVGDIDVKTARPLVEKYFADIPAGPAVARVQAAVPEPEKIQRDLMEDTVGQTLLSRAWAVPPFDSQEKVNLNVAASILNVGKHSRLYKALVEEQEIATAVSANVQSGELSSIFTLYVNIKDGVEVEAAERALDKVVADFLEDGPTKREIENYRKSLEAILIRGHHSIMAKGKMLAEAELYAGSLDFVDQEIAWLRRASVADVTAAARKWLSRNYYQLTVVPGVLPSVNSATNSSSEPVSATVDAEDKNRVATQPPLGKARPMPKVAAGSELIFPEVRKGRTANGIDVVLVEKDDTPDVLMSMVFRDAGSLADQGIKAGTSNATAILMNDGPSHMKLDEYSEQRERLGVRMGFGSRGRYLSTSMMALKTELPASADLWARTIRFPAFRTEDLARWQDNVEQGVENFRNNPTGMASRALYYNILGPGHPLRRAWDEAAVANALDTDDLAAFHAHWIRPDNATVFVVGDISLADALELLEQKFGDWVKPETPLAEVPGVAAVDYAKSARFILLDRPGSQQTTIMAGRLIPPAHDINVDAFEALNSTLAGGMTARIGNNLRVEKGWSYGVHGGVTEALGQGYWVVTTSVQNDKTSESVTEIWREMEDLSGKEPATKEELELFVRSRIRSLPARLESNMQILGDMMGNYHFGRPYEYLRGYEKRLATLDLEALNTVANGYLDPEAMTWVLVGDLSLVEQGIRDLDIAVVEVWGEDGKRIR